MKQKKKQYKQIGFYNRLEGLVPCIDFDLEQIPSSDIDMGESFQDYSWIQDFEADFP